MERKRKRGENRKKVKKTKVAKQKKERTKMKGRGIVTRGRKKKRWSENSVDPDEQRKKRLCTKVVCEKY